MRRRLPPLPPLLACHAQGRTGERLQPRPADGVAAVLADSVGAVVEALQGALDLGQEVAAVGGQRHLVLALEGLGAGVGLVVTGALTAVALQRRPGALRLGDLAAQLPRLLV